MVNITLKNNTGKPYEDVRDSICKHLVGNPAFINCDIVVSDCYQNKNEIAFSLGSDCTPCIELVGELNNIKECI